MSRLLYGYLDRLPDAVHCEETNGKKIRVRRYPTYTLWRTVAMLALK